MSIFAIAVDWNVKFKKDVYYIRYKGISLKYIETTNLIYNSRLITTYRSEAEIEKLYLTMTEFLRASAYINDYMIRTSIGMQLMNDVPLKKFIGGYSEKKTIPIDIGVSEFYDVAHINNNIQAELLRLYTEANSNNNIYFQILFFWHTLVYPSKKHSDAVKYINQNIHVINSDIYNIDYINKTSTNKNITTENFGEYIKNNARHAIAHIVRNNPVDFSISIDNLKQEKHLYALAQALKILAKYRLDNDFNMKENAPGNICSYFNPDNETLNMKT